MEVVGCRFSGCECSGALGLRGSRPWGVAGAKDEGLGFRV